MKASHSKVNCDQCPSKHKGLFCHIEKNVLDTVDQNKITNIFKKGQVIFHEGNPPMGLYCLHQGVIKLTKTGINGRESITRLVLPGDVIGHRSLFNNENYLATATALEDATVCFLDRNFIQRILHDEPSVSLKLIQLLSRDMGQAESRMASLVQKSVPERIVDFLLMLNDSFGVKLPSGKIKLDLKLTREEIASLVGTTNETVIRCISDLKSQGIVEQDGKYIIILNLSELENLVAVNA